ncbi:GGDEF domain-containing protein [Candidatus Poribacteria bacterium]|nr:GGDEF domain-containing protein [Candidatus Poribacteria bacterium]
MGVAWVALTGAIDYFTGYEVRLFPLYFLPVAYVAWREPPAAAIGISVLSAAVWGYSNWLSGRMYSSSWIWPINILSQLIAFGTVGFLVAGLRKSLSAEKNLSRQDPLTGLANARAFREGAGLLLAVARRTAQPVTVAYLDLDNFKQVNDDFGHHAGDRALTEIARILGDHVRASDLTARLGGDEFALLLMNTDAAEARISLERLRELASEAMKRNGWPVTISIGAACYASAPGELEDALARSDSLMYRAKQAGKNRVHIELAEGSAGGR